MICRRPLLVRALLMSQISEIDFLRTLDESLEQLPPDAQSRVLAWVNAKYGIPQAMAPIIPKHMPSPPAPAESNLRPAATQARKSKVRKSNFTILKDLSLTPAGKQSFRDFVAAKKPT